MRKTPIMHNPPPPPPKTRKVNNARRPVFPSDRIQPADEGIIIHFIKLLVAMVLILFFGYIASEILDMLCLESNK